MMVAAVMLTWSPAAHAYAWMIRHEYASCAVCHADPSGGSLLTPYGRAQGEILLRSQYGANVEEPGRVKDFLWGAFSLPDDKLLLGGDVRDAILRTTTGSGASAVTNTQFLPMQADLEGQLTLGGVRANASFGYEHDGALEAQVTDRAEDNLVSRVYWLGIDFGEDKAWLLRAGRVNLPFGIRQIEHTFFVRASTRTDTNDAQEDGVALAYTGNKVRGELMGIIGNYQLRPDAYRERGYSGLVEWAPATRVALGVSSLMTYAALPNPELPFSPPLAAAPLLRQAHGVFARVAPWKPVVALVELDALINDQPNAPGSRPLTEGWAGLCQFDIEPLQGLHAILAAEGTTDPVLHGGTSVSGWFGAAWFFGAHADLRVDEIIQRLAAGTPSSISAMSLLAQIHLYL
jgi:hypothetical protein